MRSAATDALARGVAIGAGGSRLLRGHDPEHAALEAEAARFFGAESALFFGGGFLANAALFSALPQQGDVVIYDALIHASAHDGMRLGAAETLSFAHNDPQSAEDAIAGWRAGGGMGRVWLACESLYSMNGDCAPLSELYAVVRRHDGFLLLDEAHATGVFGPHGRGLGHTFGGAEDVISLHTCGKALGVSGALVCAAAPLIDMLVNRARGFIYATAPSPLVAALVRAALARLAASDDLTQALCARIARAHRAAESLDAPPPRASQILPIVLGDDRRTMAAAERMRARGYDIRGVRPPTVPRGQSRLRVAITLNAETDVIDAMFDALAEELAAL